VGHIDGTVTDTSANVLVGARVALQPPGNAQMRTLSTDDQGAFRFINLPPGVYRITVAAAGFSPSAPLNVTLEPGQYLTVPAIVLHVATASTKVRVAVSHYDIATAQVQLQEKQRVLGFIPNFYVSYIWDAEPLTPGQKFSLALHSTLDPITFLSAAGSAGLQQYLGQFPGYGQGAEGYAKRFGATYTDGFTSLMLGGAILPSLLHQDPRYFYKGVGSRKSRALYAVSTIFRCRGDDGHWEWNYSNLLGTAGAAGISNAYYPAADRGLSLTVQNTFIEFGAQAVGTLFQEFVVRKLSPHLPAPVLAGSPSGNQSSR
jgi:hypothetical protein